MTGRQGPERHNDSLVVSARKQEKKEVPEELSARQQDLKTRVIKEKEEEIKVKEANLLKALTNVGNIVHEVCRPSLSLL